jgi:hypothetical protein
MSPARGPLEAELVGRLAGHLGDIARLCDSLRASPTDDVRSDPNAKEDMQASRRGQLVTATK